MSEQAQENIITDKMVKKITYLIHKYADLHKIDYAVIQKKCRKAFAYENLARVHLEDGHKIIDKLTELTGGEEEQQQEAIVTDDLTEHLNKVTPKKEEEAFEDDPVTATMRQAIRAAVDITVKEVVEKEVPVMGLGGFVLEIGKVIFETKMAEEASER